MSLIIIEILVLLFLTVLNGIFAMSEIAIVSARKARLQQRAEKGNRKARLALDLSSSPNDFLSTIQVGITLVGVLAGAFGGATLAQHLAVSVSRIPFLIPYAQTIAVGLVVIAITYLSLILGELVPKRVALNNPERVAVLIAKPMERLSKLASPVVWLLGASTNAFLWIFRLRRTTEPPITEDEIRILIRQGTDAGVIEREERDIVERVFRLGNRRASNIMTTRKDLVVLYTTDSKQVLLRKITSTGHSSYPLCEGTLDNVLGIVRVQDILIECLSGRAFDLRALVREPLALPETIQSLKLLGEFKKAGSDIILLLDEYGGLQGIVTAADVLKALVGSVSQLATPTIVQRPDGSWLVDGMLSLQEFKEVLHLEQLSGEKSGSIETVGGFILTLFGNIPAEGNTITWKNFRFEVLDMDGLRVDKILITPLPGNSSLRNSE